MTENTKTNMADAHLEEGQDQESIAAGRRTFVRMTLINEFHIESAFIGVPKVARILGLAPTTIYGYMRQGTFFIPYRLFNTSPMVCIDDLVEWYCSRKDMLFAVGEGDGLREFPGMATAAVAPRREVESQRDSADRLVAEALASMGLEARRPRGHCHRV
ncbi:MAG: hypothetical protein V4508_08820 [Pseudomonadota bacterium]